MTTSTKIDLPAMKADEIEMLKRHVQPGVAYVEFGCGGSTVLALAQGVGHCHSVDNDEGWIAKLRQQDEIRQAEVSGRLTFHHIDIGPLRKWGMPASKARMADWPRYFLAIWAQVDGDPDVVLIDGRFRTACALVTMTLCPPSTTILVHDFIDRSNLRANYRTLLDVAHIVEQSSNLVSLRLKADITRGQVLSRLSTVWTDPA